MIERTFAPGGKVVTQTKDLDTVAAVAAEAGVTLPFATLADDLFHAALAHGDGALDHSALFLELERINGVGGSPE
jgi:2-hydroxy-3-oxopropionate reductase